MPNLKSVRRKTKELLRFHSGCHGTKVSLVSNQNVASAARDLVPTSKRPLSFTNCKIPYLLTSKKVNGSLSKLLCMS